MKKLLPFIQFLLLGAVLYAQPVLEWENRFDFEAGYESPQLMKISANNDIYITGISNVDTFANDILTLKINADGTTAWHHIIRNDYDDSADGLVVDNEGNCYLAGSFGDIDLDSAGFLLSYNNDSSLQWINMSALGTQGLTIDKNENIHTVSSYQKIHIRTYNLSGDLLSAFTNDTSYYGHNYNADLFEVDSSLNLYVSGTYSLTDFNSTRGFLKKFSSTGDLLADIKYDPTTKNENPVLMQVDHFGNTYLAGTIGLFYWGIFLAKFNASGILLWDYVIEHDTIHIYDLKLDADQNPVICGKEYDAYSKARNFISKFDSDGNLVWTDSPGSAGPYSHKVAHLLSDFSGNLYFAGSTFPDGIDPYFFMNKHDKYGNLLWEYETDSILLDLNDYISTMAFDNDHNILMALQSSPGSFQNRDILTLKFSDLTDIGMITRYIPSLSVAPNPFHSTTTVSCSNYQSKNQKSTLTLLDLFGREIRSCTFHNNYQLERNGISNGMYLLRVVDGNGITSTAKVIIY